MRILMTTDAVGGVWTYSVNLARELRAVAGDEVHLAVMGPPPSPSQREQAGGTPLHESGFSLEWMPDPWRDVDAAGDWLLALSKRLQPQIVHLNGYVHGTLPFEAPTLTVAHSCVRSWWRAVHGTSAPPEWEEYRRRVSAGLRAADRVVAVSRSMGDFLRLEYGCGVPEVIYNGVAGGAGEEDGAKAAGKEQAVFCAGRFWDEGKNLQAIARAAPHVKAPTYAAGEGWEPAGESPVTALGKLAAGQMDEWYRRSAVFCHPALYEPFGLAPLEAAQRSCALVLSDIASLREIWADAALFVNGRDEFEIARAINRLLDNPDDCRAMGEHAANQARLFSLDKQAHEYAGLYRRMLHLRARAVG